MKRVVTLGLILALSVLICLPGALLAQDAAVQEATAQEEAAAQDTGAQEAAAKDAAAQEAGTQTTAATVSVQDAAICQEVVDRTPMGTGDVFSPNVPELYCFTRIVGAQENTEVTHNWYYKGNLMASVVLPVNSASWRTWSKKSMSPDMMGEWMVEILSKEGVPLESIIFFLQ
jgi:hypothetical protein